MTPGPAMGLRADGGAKVIVMAHRSSSSALHAPPAVGPADAPSSVSQIDLDALEWQVRLWSGTETAKERLAFQHWLEADPAHQDAWQRVQEVSQQIHAVPDAIAGKVLRASLPPRAAQRRRDVLRGLFVLAAGSASFYAVKGTPQWSALNADYSTARGERQDLTLPDGTLLSLNTASAIDLQFTEYERRVLVRAGEVLITTAADRAPSPRPFIVQTSEGSVRALGTQFLVRRLEHTSPVQIAVQVFDGVVEIMPDSGTGPLRLDAGRQARFTRYEVQAPVDADPQAASWHRGLLVAERLRLEDFLAEVGRHRPGVLRCDPAVANLIVSGVYPLQDTDAILTSLAQALPVSVRMTTRYWVTVTEP
ncbi:MAG: FecR domain-containing protein [Pusillimonas sp.]